MELISNFLIEDLGIPLGLSLALNLFFLVQLIRGELVTRKQVDQVQKMVDTFREALASAMSNQNILTDGLKHLDVLTETFAHFLDSLPKRGDSK